MRIPLRRIEKMFPGCSMTEEKLRETILEILNFDELEFVCFGCLSYIGSVNRGTVCDGCGQIYCGICSEVLKNGKPTSGKPEIDRERCPECVKNT